MEHNVQSGHSPIHCRSCAAPVTLELVDLGNLPIANALIEPEDASKDDPVFPLRVLVCQHCRLVQTQDVLDPKDLFRPNYTYFSSHSSSWLGHARAYVADMIARFGLKPGAMHVEIASNDGYLLQYSRAAGLDCLGIEPCESVALAARAKDIPTHMAFFDAALGAQLAASGRSADLITANNVFAHVRDINGFTAGIKALLAPQGVATLEVQHLLSLMQNGQFDTIYHEHFSYLSLIAARAIFARAGLRVFDVELPPTHGGSIRFFVCHDGAAHAPCPGVERVLAAEHAYGLDSDGVYQAWGKSVAAGQHALHEALSALKEQGKSFIAYGAPAKGVTLLNYCGVGRDLLDFTVDIAPSKQGRFLPGSHLPIFAPEVIAEKKPDYVLILPWNLSAEIQAQLAYIKEWGGQFILPIPKPHILPA